MSFSPSTRSSFKLKLFSGTSNTKLTQTISSHLGLFEPSKLSVKKFADGEIGVQIDENVRGCDVFVVQSSCTPVNDNLMELFLIVDALRRASAKRVTAVIPYFGYARQDRKTRPRVPISAALVSRLIESAGVDRVLSIDLHCFSKGTEVIMGDGKVVKVEDVKEGQLVLGSDGDLLEVMNLSRGTDYMYRVEQNTSPCEPFGKVSYECSSKHILALYTPAFVSASKDNDSFIIESYHKVNELKDGRMMTMVKGKTEKICLHDEDGIERDQQEIEKYISSLKEKTIYWEIEARDYEHVSDDVRINTYQKSKPTLLQRKDFRQIVVENGIKEDYVYDVAWLFGIWIGDGTSDWSDLSLISVNIEDKEEIERIKEVGKNLQLRVHDDDDDDDEQWQNPSQKHIIKISGEPNQKNHFWNVIKSLGQGKEGDHKVVPKMLLSQEYEVREWFLAGLIDSNGHNDKKSKTVTIKFVHKDVAEGLTYLSRSLGIPSSTSIQNAFVDNYGKNNILCYSTSLSYCPILMNVLSKCSIPRNKMERVEDAKLESQKVYFDVMKVLKLKEQPMKHVEMVTKDLIESMSDDEIRHIMKLHNNYYLDNKFIANLSEGSNVTSVSNFLRGIHTTNSNVRETVEKIILENFKDQTDIYKYQLKNYEHEQKEYYGFQLKTAPNQKPLFLLANSCEVHNCGQIQGFFKVPVDNLFCEPLLSAATKLFFSDLQNVCVVSPDAGGAERADLFRDSIEKVYDIKANVAVMNKKREKANVVKTMELVGSVEGCDCIIVDDMIDTAGTLCFAARILKKNGAKRVFACATHALLNGPAIERIAESPIEKLIVANTVPMGSNKQHEKLHQVCVGKMVAEAIKRVHFEQSVSFMFESGDKYLETDEELGITSKPKTDVQSTNNNSPSQTASTTQTN